LWLLTKLSLLSCNSGDCTVGVTNMVADVKTLKKRDDVNDREIKSMIAPLLYLSRSKI
jgi:hypothetical protein